MCPQDTRAIARGPKGSVRRVSGMSGQTGGEYECTSPILGPFWREPITDEARASARITVPMSERAGRSSWHSREGRSEGSHRCESVANASETP